jgi:hypothetical protein
LLPIAVRVVISTVIFYIYPKLVGRRFHGRTTLLLLSSDFEMGPTFYFLKKPLS